MSRPKTIALWIASVLMGLLFCAAGLPKVIGGPGVVDQFANWGYAAWFPRLIGVAETLGGIALFIPRVARFGAILLMAIMAGAVFTHARVGEWSRLPFVVALGVILFVIYRVRSGRGNVTPKEDA